MTIPRQLQPLDRPPRLSLFARLFIILLAAILIMGAAVPALADPGPQPLRIGLVRYLKGVSTIDISCSEDFTVINKREQKTLVTSTYLEPIKVFARPDGIEIKTAKGQLVKTNDVIRICPAKPGGLLTISAPTRSFSQYRGVLEIQRINETTALLIVNEVSLEDYLMGVLPGEMPHTFHPEALKAQAIAARTYSEKGHGRHSASGFDMCDTVHCQVYIGSGGEKPSTTKAVKETQGLVAKYDGKLILAVYSADCGGRTQSGEDAGLMDAKDYLKSVADNDGADKPDYCCTNKSHKWIKIYTPQELGTALNATMKPPLEGLKSIAFCEYDESGRVKRVDIVDGKETRTITGAELRMTCGSTVIRSAKMIVCTVEDGKICFEGKGWGHGVGLCQWGAEGLAREPSKLNAEQILKHYYTGIEIGKLH
ncbi:MAG: SpoIID/LytB domain-containing protein [Armatimonadota bacterium]|nr:SpoIID/LytB domain-containing protein [Armatimonadota bacterium]